QVQPSHGFRKFFDNAILKMDETMPQEIKDQLMGHSLGIEWHYNERDVEEGGKLREWYKKVYPYLDLSEQGIVQQKFGEQSGYIRDLKQELENQRKKASELESSFEQRLRQMQANMVESEQRFFAVLGNAIGQQIKNVRQ